MPTESFTLSEISGRLDKLLALQFPFYSRTYFQKLIEDGFVLVNGKQLKKREIPQGGDEIEVCFQLTPELSLEPQAIPLDILYEDDHVIAVNKPAGMVVHPAPGHPRGTFVNALLHHCQQLPFGETLRPGIVHRIDKDTTGILIAAKTPEAHRSLVSLFHERELTKKYLAICIGDAGEGVIDAPIKRHPIRRQEMAVLDDGKPALSEVKKIGSFHGLSCVEVTLVTGRTHQIRVHLRYRGTPILGDSIYGSKQINEKFNASRQLLHAWKMELNHPISHEPLFLEAPIPADMQRFLELNERRVEV